MAQKCPSCDYPYVPNGSKVKCPNCGNEINGLGFTGCLGIIIILIALSYFLPSTSNKNSAIQSNVSENTQSQQKERIKDNSNQDFNNSDSNPESENLELDESQNQQSENRDPREKDVANVWFNPSYSLYDFLTDELILPNKEGIYNIYYSTNEDPTPKKFVGDANELTNLLCYKFLNFESCQKWCNEHNSK